MTTFIETLTGEYLPIDRIASIGEKTDQDGDVHFRTHFHRVQTIDGKEHKIWAPTMASHVVSMTPADGWECLIPRCTYDDSITIDVVPVLAWGSNLLGERLCITPDGMIVPLSIDEPLDPWGFRKVGTAKVYVPGWGTSDDEQAFLNHLPTVVKVHLREMADYEREYDAQLHQFRWRQAHEALRTEAKRRGVNRDVDNDLPW
jgi:hypothetical protein